MGTVFNLSTAKESLEMMLDAQIGFSVFLRMLLLDWSTFTYAILEMLDRKDRRVSRR